jgi:hypothetical protein
MRHWWKLLNFAPAVMVAIGFTTGMFHPTEPLLLLFVPLPFAMSVVAASGGAPTPLRYVSYGLNLLAALFFCVGFGASLIAAFSGRSLVMVPLFLGLALVSCVNAALMHALVRNGRSG